MKDLNKVVANNLIKYRLLFNLTQKELAKKINYSDKSVSKWERGDSLPDLAVLVKLCEIYNVEINVFLNENTEDQKIELPEKFYRKKHFLISILSAGLVWFVATIIFVALFMTKSTESFAWLSFVGAVPASSIVLLVFSELWGNNLSNIIFTSIINWGSIVFVCLIFSINKLWTLCFIGVILEILIILWFMFKNKYNKKSNRIDN